MREWDKSRLFSGHGDSILHLLKYLLRSQGTKYLEQYLFPFILIGTRVTRGHKGGEKNPCQLFLQTTRNRNKQNNTQTHTK